MVELLSRGIVSKVYHSVEILNANNERYPGYKQEDEWMYIGPDDTKFMNAYVRELAGFKVDKIIELGGGIKAYRGIVDYRMVFFNDFEKRNHDQLLIDLLAFTFFPNIKLKKVINSSEEVLREEAKINSFTFGATTFYKAIDFTVTVQLVDKRCDVSIGCGNWPNPIDKDTLTDRDFTDDFS